MKSYCYLLFLILAGGFLTSCSDNNDPGKYLEVNSWIQTNMEYYYFWNDLVPDEADGEVLPQTFFGNMLEPNDIFSFITDDAETYLNSVAGSSFTAGYSPSFNKFTNSDQVFIIVEYVYPGTPADTAGLKRGDIIVEINGQPLTASNYLDLYYSEAQNSSVTLGSYDEEESVIFAGEILHLQKLQMELNPVVYTSIFEHGANKTGYIFYSRFVDGSQDQFVQSLQDTLASLNAQGITDLIIDLRYNPGGTISTVTAFANALAPLSAINNNEVFVSFQYNEDLQQEIIDQEGLDSQNLFLKFSESVVNMGLERIYFLTTSMSASASELLINGLEPYLDVVIVGTPTFGKFYGAFVFDGRQARQPNNYAIAPVVVKYANASGVTDFRNGLMPDYEVQEDLFNAKALGDSTDPLLAKALELITGVSMPAKEPAFIPYKSLDDLIELKKGNILFNPRETNLFKK